MSQTETQKPVISMEDKAKIFEFHKLFKASPKSITQEMRTFVAAKNDICWKMKDDESIPIETRLSIFDLMKINHEILGRNFKDEWKPRDKSKPGQKQAWIATNDQRAKNCAGLMEYLKTIKTDKSSIWDEMTSAQKAEVLSNAWGTVKQ